MTTPYGDGYSISDDATKKRPDPRTCRVQVHEGHGRGCEQATVGYLLHMKTGVTTPACREHGIWAVRKGTAWQFAVVERSTGNTAWWKDGIGGWAGG